MGAPARRYSWAPFAPGNEHRVEPGNDLALKHGAWSPKLIEPAAQELVDQVLEQAAVPESTIAYLTDGTYLLAIRRWARVEAQVDRVAAWLTDHGDEIDDEGDVRPAANLLAKLIDQSERLSARLGLDPLSRARLGRDVAGAKLDLAKHWAMQDAERDNQVSRGEHNG